LTFPKWGTKVPRMATRYPEKKIRFKTFAALDRIAKAARIMKRSPNEFIRISAEEAAEKILTTSKAEQLTVEAGRPALNQ